MLESFLLRMENQRPLPNEGAPRWQKTATYEFDLASALKFGRQKNQVNLGSLVGKLTLGDLQLPQ
jgi:hypothetical protein